MFIRHATAIVPSTALRTPRADGRRLPAEAAFVLSRSYPQPNLRSAHGCGVFCPPQVDQTPGCGERHAPPSGRLGRASWIHDVGYVLCDEPLDRRLGDEDPPSMAKCAKLATADVALTVSLERRRISPASSGVSKRGVAISGERRRHAWRHRWALGRSRRVAQARNQGAHATPTPGVRARELTPAV